MRVYSSGQNEPGLAPKVDDEFGLKIKCDYTAVRKDGGSACCVNVMELVMKAITKTGPPRINNGGLVGISL